MNQTDRDEVADLRRHLNKILMWAAGVCITLAVGFGSFSLSQQQQITTNANVSQSALRTAEENREDIKLLVGRFGDISSAVSGLQADIAGQRRTLDRIDASISELTRYLRGRE